MSAENRYDVVVVGGRVAGASTALLLARAGVRVALVDRSAYGSDTVSTHGLMRAGVLQLSRWGLLPQVLAAGTPPIRRTLFRYAGDGLSPERVVQVSIRPAPGVDALCAPRRHVLDRILVDAAVSAGAHVHHETAVVGLLEAGGRVDGIRAQDRSGHRLDLRADLTVGADGIRSTVAEHVRTAVVRQGKASSAVLYRYYADLPTAGYEWAYGDTAAAGLIPTNDGLTCAFVATAPDRMRALRRHGTDRAFATLLSRAGPGLVERLGLAAPASRVHGWAGAPGFVRRSWGPGWALVGDAGYYKDPITTHGMTDALRDAELLAVAALDTLAGDVAEHTALARYESLRNELSGGFFSATESVASYEWDIPRIEALLRQVSSAMSDEVDLLQALPAYDGPGTRRLTRPGLRR